MTKDTSPRSAATNSTIARSAYSTEAWHRIMAVNATGVFFGIKHAIPAMVANGGGSIVNLSSIAGIIGSEHVHMAYNASKAAVRLMTKSVACSTPRITSAPTRFIPASCRQCAHLVALPTPPCEPNACA